MYLTGEYNILITNIRYYRTKSNLTQEQLAELSDLSVSYIKQLESGKIFKNVSFITLSKLAKAFNIETKELLTKNTKTPV